MDAAQLTDEDLLNKWKELLPKIESKFLLYCCSSNRNDLATLYGWIRANTPQCDDDFIISRFFLYILYEICETIIGPPNKRDSNRPTTSKEETQQTSEKTTQRKLERNQRMGKGKRRKLGARIPSTEQSPNDIEETLQLLYKEGERWSFIKKRGIGYLITIPTKEVGQRMKEKCLGDETLKWLMEHGRTWDELNRLGYEFLEKLKAPLRRNQDSTPTPASASTLPSTQSPFDQNLDESPFDQNLDDANSNLVGDDRGGTGAETFRPANGGRVVDERDLDNQSVFRHENSGLLTLLPFVPPTNNQTLQPHLPGGSEPVQVQEEWLPSTFDVRQQREAVSQMFPPESPTSTNRTLYFDHDEPPAI